MSIAIQILLQLLPYILKWLESLDVETQEVLLRAVHAANQDKTFEVQETIKAVLNAESDE